MVQVLSGLQGEVMLGGAVCLARQGFLDAAQDLLTQHRAAVGTTHVPSLQAQLRLRIAQVPSLPLQCLLACLLACLPASGTLLGQAGCLAALS